MIHEDQKNVRYECRVDSNSMLTSKYCILSTFYSVRVTAARASRPRRVQTLVAAAGVLW